MTSSLGPVTFAPNSEPVPARVAASPSGVEANAGSGEAPARSGPPPASEVVASGVARHGRATTRSAVAVLGAGMAGAAATGVQVMPTGGLAELRARARQVQQQLGEQPLPITNHSSKVIMKLFGG